MVVVDSCGKSGGRIGGSVVSTLVLVVRMVG